MDDKTDKQMILPYDPGVLPILPAPSPGDSIAIEVAGLPPVKDVSQSIRNRNHPLHPAFVALRNAATAVMAGRAWVFGPVEMHLTIFGPNGPARWSINDYFGGITDTLDGSSGRTFTYLPIVFEDDCQVYSAQLEWEDAPEHKYVIEVRFWSQADLARTWAAIPKYACT